VTKSESEFAQAGGADESAAESRPAARQIDSHNAATLAADELNQDRAAATSGSPPATAPTDGVASLPAARSARFTTIEAEEARLRAEQQRSWVTMAIQLAGLAAVLGGMAALALYLSRPPSADELYRTITSTSSADDDASLGNVEREINEFLAMYPNDSRAAELVRYREQVLLDRVERKLQRGARGNDSAEAELIPAERLYLRAVGMANDSPEAAAATLKSLIDLYGAEDTRGGGDQSSASQTAASENDNVRERMNIVVQLAERRLAALQTTIAKQRDVQIADLRERVKAAQQLADSDPQRAAAIYRAIVDLHSHDEWAAEVVQEATSQLARLQK
jgi:hypothetical protein